ncbi:MAG: WYL domain-containing protein [Planctomycetota bacterium]|nr:WYL domain-containing protein [Planctomycetota bacterium]
MKISRIYRLLRLITMLQSGRSYTVAQLADELEVSRRTVFRDLNVLEMAHIPYYYDRDEKSYRINHFFFLSPVNLTLPEALAMMVPAGQSSSSSSGPLCAARARGALKLESVLPQAVRDYLGTIMDHLKMVPPPPARQEGLEGMFDRLAVAVAERKLCRIVYISFHEHRQINVTVEPARLMFVGRAWYMIGYSHRHRQRRTFKLGRIKKLTVQNRKFDPTDHSETDGQRDFGDAWSMIPEGRIYRVHLRFRPKVAGNVAEVNWHHSQRVEWNDDGSIDFHVRVDGLGEIAWWILGYGDQVRVISPVSLARRVAGVARKVAAQYSAERT